jgi:hypothetical protein
LAIYEVERNTFREQAQEAQDRAREAVRELQQVRE